MDVRMPDGTVIKNIPEGTSKEDVLAKYQQKYYSQDEIESNQGLGFDKGMTDPMIGIKRGIENITGGAKIPFGLSMQGITSITNPNLQQTTAAQEQAQMDQKVAEAAERGEEPGMMGEIGGNIALTAPTAMLKTGQAIKGGIEGAILSNQDNLFGRAKDAAIGAATGVVGQRAFDALSGAIKGKTGTIAADLYDKGVENLTVGQGMGGWAKGVEDALMSVPWVGDIIANARMRGVEDFNRVLMNNILEPLNKTIPKGVAKFGRDAIKNVGDQLSKGYDDLLPKLSVGADDTFKTNTTNIIGEAIAGMSETNKNTLLTIMKNKIPAAFNRQGGMTGNQYKNLKSSFTNMINQKKIAEPEIADALGEIVAEFDDLLIRANPEYAVQLKGLSQAYSKLIDVERAASSVGASSAERIIQETGDEVLDSGIILPAQYLAAVKAGNKSARKRQFARGDAQGQKLAEQAKHILPSKLPDSGTAKRAALLSLIGTGGGFAFNPVAGSAALAGSAMYTKPVQKLINKGLFSRRGQTAYTMAEYLKEFGPTAGRLATAGTAYGNRN